MRLARLKIKGRDAIYHCTSRIVGSQYLLNKKEKKFLIRQLYQVSEFCGVEILSYCMMDNHYHAIIKVPGMIELSDEELLRKVELYYGTESCEVLRLKRSMKREGIFPARLRNKYLNMMGDVSQHQKLFKQKFSIWYNKTHNRGGTLWSGRFECVLIEEDDYLKQIFLGYVDLNPVRAGMVNDPAEYPYSGYAMAVNGDELMRKAIALITGESDWMAAHDKYRNFLIGRGILDKKRNGKVLRIELLNEVQRKNRRLLVNDMLHLKLNYLKRGTAVGSRRFLEMVELANQDKLKNAGRSRYHDTFLSDSNRIQALTKIRSSVFE